MSKQLVFIVDGQVRITEVSDEEFARDEGTVTKSQYAEQAAIFEAMIAELNLMRGGTTFLREHGAEFMRKHGVWLHNLATTGFAIDCTQFVRDN